MVDALLRRRGGRTALFVICSVITSFIVGAAFAQQTPASAGPPATQLIEDLVAANRILADQGLLDGWGHVSVRHNRDPNRFLMARGVAAQLVIPKDILEFDLDSQPVDTHGLPMSALFTERYIHGEIYKLRPDVIAIVHTHAPSLIPFGVTKVPLQPMYHRSAFISFGIPVFEIRERAGMTDMLIRNATLGHNLAEALGDHPAALMRGHGAVDYRTVAAARGEPHHFSRTQRDPPGSGHEHGSANYLHGPGGGAQNRGARRAWTCPHLGGLEAEGDGEAVKLSRLGAFAEERHRGG